MLKYSEVEFYDGAKSTTCKYNVIKDFAKSKELFRKGTKAFKVLNLLAEVFVERCDYFTKNPPPANWDGTWTMTDK